MIPEGHKESIIITGIDFIKSITKAYGSETGMNLWSQISTVLDPNIKSEIFFALITGNYSPEYLTIGFPLNTARNDIKIINCIKEIRMASNLSLIDAKNLVEELIECPSRTVRLPLIKEANWIIIKKNLQDLKFVVY